MLLHYILTLTFPWEGSSPLINYIAVWILHQNIVHQEEETDQNLAMYFHLTLISVFIYLEATKLMITLSNSNLVRDWEEVSMQGN